MSDDRLDLDVMDELIRERRTDNRAIRRRAAALEIAAYAPALVAELRAKRERVKQLEKSLLCVQKMALEDTTALATKVRELEAEVEDTQRVADDDIRKLEAENAGLNNALEAAVATIKEGEK